MKCFVVQKEKVSPREAVVPTCKEGLDSRSDLVSFSFAVAGALAGALLGALVAALVGAIP